MRLQDAQDATGPGYRLNLIRSEIFLGSVASGVLGHTATISYPEIGCQTTDLDP